MSAPAAPWWPEAAHGFPPGRLDALLLWAVAQGASDIAFQTGSPACIEVDGVLRRATAAALDGVVLGRLCERLYDATGEGILRSGRAIDCSYAVALGRGVFQRFRCNLAPVQAGGGFAVNITLRVLPGAPPSFEELGIEDEIAAAWDLCKGLTLVTGVPGSGKSTLLAAGTRRLLERGAGRVQSYEAPIEFVFDGIGGDTGAAMMSSSEIPRHFQSFAEGLRSSLRRRPAAVIVGEARDRETVEAVVRAADYGIAVFSTAHTIGVAATVRRLLAEFSAPERAERGAALIDAMTLVVTQVLLPNPAGGRTALREWLAFDAPLKAALLESPQAAWPARIAEALDGTGNDLARAADPRPPRRADRRGRVAADRGRRRREGRAMLRRDRDGSFRSVLARHHAPGPVLRVRRPPARPADAVAVHAGLVDDGRGGAGDGGVPRRRGPRLPLPGRARRAARRERRTPPGAPCRTPAPFRGFWLMRAMAAAALAGLLLGAIDPASAAFRYVAPDGEPTVESHEAGPGAVETAIVEEPVIEAGPEVWRVHPGETLREVLARWGARAGVEIVFLTDRGYRLHGARAFEGGFAGSVEALFQALGHLPHPPAAEFAPGGRSLSVTHRATATEGIRP